MGAQTPLALAEAGYRGYAESTGGKTFDGRDMPAWTDLPPRTIEAWVAAVVAVQVQGASENGRGGGTTFGQITITNDAAAMPDGPFDPAAAPKVVNGVATFGDYGTVEYELKVNEHGGATSRIVRADDRIGLSAELVKSGDIETEVQNDHEHIVVLDVNGEYRYRVVDEADEGRTLVCERV